MTIRNIVLFCPSKVTGGHEYLSVGLADCLVCNFPQYNVYYCDYSDGFSHTRWHSDKVHYIDYISDKVPVKIPSNSVVIVQLNLISRPDQFILEKDNSFIIYWNLHLLNIKSQIFTHGHYFLTKKERKILGKELCVLSEIGIVKYMSYGAYAKLIEDFYQPPQKFSWLPNIAQINKSCQKPFFTRLSSNEVKFCWLGRLDEEKSRNILTYMNELEEINKTCNLTLSIIGRGPAEDMLKKKSENYSFPIKFVGEKRDEELDTYIRNETEIGLASGTSAYEFSLRGKPVIMEWVIDKVYEAGIRNQYVFTDEEEKYDYLPGHELKRIGASSFRNKLREILEDYEAVSRRGYDFVMNKSADKCAAKLDETINCVLTHDLNDVFSHVDKVCKILRKGKKRLMLLSKIKSILFKLKLIR